MSIRTLRAILGAVPLLDGAGHDQTAEEEEVGVQEVLGADLVGGQDAQEGEEDDGQQG